MDMYYQYHQYVQVYSLVDIFDYIADILVYDCNTNNGRQ